MIPIKVLIFGNYNPMTLSLISRLDKEGHTIFVITGSDRKIKSKPREVFQQYNFPYNSESVEYVIDNIDADIAIFVGSIDSLYDLENQPSHISDYLAGVTNMVLYLKNSNIKQLIYVSSLDIFSGNTESIIDENTVPNPRGNIDKTILIGEKICKNYDKERKFKVSILRFSEIYGTYDGEYLENNVCTRICKNIIDGQDIEILKNREHNLIYVDDATDAIYKVIGTEGCCYDVYHVGVEQDNVCLEEDIVDALKDKIADKSKIKVIENAEDVVDKQYSIEKIKDLNFNTKYSVKDKIKELYSAVSKSNGDKYLVDVEKTSLLSRIFKLDGDVKNKVLPFVENLAFFILLNIFIFFTKSMSFHEVIDFYLLYVVVIGLIYGYEQTVFTVILSVVFKIYIAYSWDTRFLALTDYYMYLWILELFTIGVLVGYLKEQYKIKYLDMKDKNAYLDLQLKNIKEINKGNEEIKDLYEKRLLNYKDSFGRIYEIISEIDTIEPQAIIFKSIQVIAKIMKTKDVSIYISGGNSSFYRLMASSSEKSKTLKGSLKVSEYPNIFEKLEKNEIYINGNMDPNYPIMAGGTYKNGKLKSIIMIWSLPFESNNLYQANVFGVVCKLIERSLTIAYEYMENISRSYNMKNDNVLDKESFEKILELYKCGVKDSIVEFFILNVKKDSNINKYDFIEIIKKSVRETDFIGDDGENCMRILLTSTNRSESAYVVDRLKSNGIEVEKGESIEDCI